MNLKTDIPNFEIVDNVYYSSNGTFGNTFKIESDVVEELMEYDGSVSLNYPLNSDKKQYVAIYYKDGYWVGGLTKNRKDLTLVKEYRARNIIDVIENLNE